MSCAAAQRSFGVLRDAYVAAIVLQAVLVVVVLLLIIDSCPEVSTLVIVFLLKL